MPAPVQHDVDCIASFVEACGELEREPFFGKDEPLSSGTGPGKAKTYTMGDRFHFRSALISFRRIWLQKEASYWKRVVQILRRTLVPREITTFSDHEEANIVGTCKREAWPVSLKTTVVIDLWLNTVFAHGGIIGSTKRSNFDAAVITYGHAQFEYAFRLSVKFLGGHFMNLSRLAALPALEHYRTANQMRPSFKIGAAFGSKRREITGDGQIIIRQGSTEFYTEELIAERFIRILGRQAHKDVRFILDHLDNTPTERLRATLRAHTISELITLLDGQIRVVGMASADFDDKPGIYASAGLAGKRVNIFLDNIVETHELGVKTLNKKFAAFQADLLNG